MLRVSAEDLLYLMEFGKEKPAVATDLLVEEQKRSVEHRHYSSLLP